MFITYISHEYVPISSCRIMSTSEHEDDIVFHCQITQPATFAQLFNTFSFYDEITLNITEDGIDFMRMEPNCDAFAHFQIYKHNCADWYFRPTCNDNDPKRFDDPAPRIFETIDGKPYLSLPLNVSAEYKRLKSYSTNNLLDLTYRRSEPDVIFYDVYSQQKVKIYTGRGVLLSTITSERIVVPDLQFDKCVEFNAREIFDYFKTCTSHSNVVTIKLHGTSLDLYTVDQHGDNRRLLQEYKHETLAGTKKRKMREGCLSDAVQSAPPSMLAIDDVAHLHKTHKKTADTLAFPIDVDPREKERLQAEERKIFDMEFENDFDTKYLINYTKAHILDRKVQVAMNSDVLTLRYVADSLAMVLFILPGGHNKQLGDKYDIVADELERQLQNQTSTGPMASTSSFIVPNSSFAEHYREREKQAGETHAPKRYKYAPPKSKVIEKTSAKVVHGYNTRLNETKKLEIEEAEQDHQKDETSSASTGKSAIVQTTRKSSHAQTKSRRSSKAQAGRGKRQTKPRRSEKMMYEDGSKNDIELVCDMLMDTFSEVDEEYAEEAGDLRTQSDDHDDNHESECFLDVE